jgi:hypothetical protein
MLQDTSDGSAETTIRAIVEFKLGEPYTGRSTGSGYPVSKVPLESMQIIDFYAKSHIVYKNGSETLTGFHPEYASPVNLPINKLNARLYHKKDNFREMALLKMNPIYYKFQWSNGKQGSFGFYFLEQADGSALDEAIVGDYWFDQIVTEGDGYHEYGGKGYRLTERNGLHKEEWFEWSFMK